MSSSVCRRRADGQDATEDRQARSQRPTRPGRPPWRRLRRDQTDQQKPLRVCRSDAQHSAGELLLPLSAEIIHSFIKSVDLTPLIEVEIYVYRWKQN